MLLACHTPSAASQRPPAPAASSSSSRTSKQARSPWARQNRHCRGGRPQRHAAVAAAQSEEELSSSSSPAAAAAAAAADGVPLQPSTSYDGSGEEGQDDSREFAVAMAKVAWETKAEDILVLHVAPVIYWTRYMLLCTVYSRPQLNAILGKMTKEAEEAHGRTLSVSPAGTAGGWELLDYGDVVVHILTAEQRDFYDLEGFYGAAEEVPLPFEAEERADVDTWSKKL